MRVLILADVHANLEALNAVLLDAGPFDVIWSLGDIVGYGPEPNECIERLLQFEHVAIAGNHDWGVLGKLDLYEFNAEARIANLWTREQLTPGSRQFLETLPESLVVEGVTLAHGSPRYPIWEYLVYPGIACQSFGYFDTSLCFVGHTHVPAIFLEPAESENCRTLYPTEEGPVALAEERYIINPGSVGQPRDGDPRAAYLILDTAENTIQHRRVAYDVRRTQEKMRAVGLPLRMITRLEYGW